MQSDEQLVALIRKGKGLYGEQKAFDVLYRRYEARLYGYILRLVSEPALAEDLFQDVFLTVLKDRNFKTEGESRFGAWLFTVARNRCLTHLRNQNRQQEKLQQLPDSPPSQDPGAKLEQRQLLRTAMANLSLPQQDALLLKEVGGLTYQEIAQLQAVPEGTAKSRLHFALKTLRRLLKESDL